MRREGWFLPSIDIPRPGSKRVSF